MKGLWRYFSLPFEDCRKTMKKITKTRQPDQYLERVNLFFETEAQLRRPKADLSAWNAFFQEICRSGFPLRRLMTLTPLDIFLVSWFSFLSWSFCAKSWNSLASIFFRLLSSINLLIFLLFGWIVFLITGCRPNSANRLSARINARWPFLRIWLSLPVTYWYSFLRMWNKKWGFKPDNGYRSMRG